MKFLKLLIVTAVMAAGIAQTGASAEKPTKKVEAYYFHFTARCETCRAVEAAAKENLAVLYPDLVREGMVTFQAINLDEKSSKPIAKKLKVPGQSLLLVEGETQVNLTNEAFLYARPNPDKFKAIMKEKVDALLK
jgi:hypothetical protein